MISFTLSLIALVLGYLFYGKLVERVFGPDDRVTPAVAKADGLDYIVLPNWKIFMIQFLNIAGTGPIFGAIMGAKFGPAAYLWIVFGCIFAGAVHDYLCGMICIRDGGVSLPEIIGNELGGTMRIVMRIGSMVLLVLVGAVFVTTPAALLDKMTPDMGWFFSNGFWLTIIFLYFILATLLPIDKLIGKVYPLFGLALLLMAVGICWGIYTQEGWMPEITDAPFVTHHPKGLPIFPLLCVTIACGAISGFHGTQSPLMARCMTSERLGRPIFYGAMITEGVVALIWAAAAIKFASTLPGPEGATAYEKLAALGNPAIVVKEISVGWLGTAGAVLAILGVVAAPITSGDTAFRSARLIAADFLGYDQKSVKHRLILCVPFFIITTGLFFIDFAVLWRYFAWTNQTLACFMLWAAAVWLTRRKHNCLIAFIPALFMAVVSTSYILTAPEGFRLPLPVGLAGGFILMAVQGFHYWKYIHHKPYK